MKKSNGWAQIPYGAQLLIAIGVAKGLDVSVDSFALLTHLYYLPILSVMVVLSIAFRTNKSNK